MQIIIFNQKGGVGKSMLATQIALYFDTTIINLDPYSVLEKTLEDGRVYSVALDEEIPKITSAARFSGCCLITVIPVIPALVLLV